MAQETMKFVAVINRALTKDKPIGSIFNAVGHMSAGLAEKLHKDEVKVQYNKYEDADGGVHPSIPNDPFIILGIKNSSQLAKIRDGALSAGIEVTDFTNTMFEGGSEAQLARTRITKAKDLEYVGVCMYGPASILDPITKKCSVFNPTLANESGATKKDLEGLITQIKSLEKQLETKDDKIKNLMEKLGLSSDNIAISEDQATSSELDLIGQVEYKDE